MLEGSLFIYFLTVFHRDFLDLELSLQDWDANSEPMGRAVCKSRNEKGVLTSLIPQTTVVFPHLTIADASAVFTESTFNFMFRCS